MVKDKPWLEGLKPQDYPDYHPFVEEVQKMVGGIVQKKLFYAHYYEKYKPWWGFGLVIRYRLHLVVNNSLTGMQYHFHSLADAKKALMEELNPEMKKDVTLTHEVEF